MPARTAGAGTRKRTGLSLEKNLAAVEEVALQHARDDLERLRPARADQAEHAGDLAGEHRQRIVLHHRRHLQVLHREHALRRPSARVVLRTP